MSDTPDDGGPAGPIIDRFGGIRPLAAKLQVPVSTVQGWKKRGQIPAGRRAELVAAAAHHGIPLSEAELDAALSADPLIEADTATAEAASESPAARPAAPEVTAPQAAPRSPAAPPPARRGGITGALALLLALAALGLAALPYFLETGAPGAAPAPPPAVPEVTGGDIAELGQRIDALAGQVRDLETQAATRPSDPPPLDGDAVQKQIADLAARLQALEQAAAAPAAGPPDLAAVTERLDRLEERLGTLAETLSTAQAELARQTRAQSELQQQTQQLAESTAGAGRRAQGAEALVLAAGQLESAVATGRPYADRLAAARALAGDDAALAALLDRLAPRAEAGIVLEAALRTRLADIAPLALQAERGRQDGNWMDQALDRLSSLVRVRRVTPNASDPSSEAVLARAEQALARSELDGAIAELEKLQGPAAQVMAPLLEDARATREARAAAAELGAKALQALAGTAAR